MAQFSENSLIEQASVSSHYGLHLMTKELLNETLCESRVCWGDTGSTVDQEHPSTQQTCEGNLMNPGKGSLFCDEGGRACPVNLWIPHTGSVQPQAG